MNELNEEFERHKKEHESFERNVYFESADDMRNWLGEMLPIEQFFKRLYDLGEECDFWSFANYYYEKYRFNFQYVNSNISVARHFRYDQHEFHTHDFFQINYCYSGEGTIYINTKNKPYAVKMCAGDVNLLASQTPHHVSAFSDDCVIIKFYIRKSTFERTFFSWLREDDILSEFFQSAIRGGKNAYINFRTGKDEQIEELMLSIYKELMNHRDYFGIISESRLTELFCLLVREHISSAETRFDNKKQDGASARIFAYLHEKYSETSLETAARDLGYSKSYLCRIVSKQTGKTFCGLLNEVRISEAKKLLVSGNENVAEVGRAVGYNSDEHFHRCFKEIAGTSPREWMKSIRYEE